MASKSKWNIERWEAFFNGEISYSEEAEAPSGKMLNLYSAISFVDS